MGYLFLSIISIVVSLLSIDFINFLYIIAIVFIALVSIKILSYEIGIEEDNKLVIPIIIVLFANLIGNFPSLNFLSYLIFCVKEITLLYIVFQYTDSCSFFRDEDFSFNKRVGINLLFFSEGIKFVVNALMINFDNIILDYFYVVGYILPIVAIIYLGFIRGKELGENNTTYSTNSYVRPGGNRKRK